MAFTTSTLTLLLVSLSSLIVCITQSSGVLKQCQECPSGWWCHAGHCYALTIDGSTWQTARQRCVGGGGELASVTTAEEQEFVVALVRASQEPVYVGLSSVDSSTFRWSDGVPVEYTNWGRERDIASEGCVAMNSDDGHWRVVDCKETLPFVCKKRSESYVKARLVRVGQRNNGRIELLFRGQWRPVCSRSWHKKEAEVVCHQLMKDEVANPGGVSEVTVGRRRGNGIHECLHIDCEGNEKEVGECQFGVEQWDSVGVTCASWMEDGVPVEKLKRSSPDCHSGWTNNRGTCYYIENEYAAVEFLVPGLCKQKYKEGQMISITSSQEQDFISRLLQPNKTYWIGLNNSDKTGMFEWSDKSAVKFSQWDVYEPKVDKASAHHDCVQIKSVSGKFVWQTVRCDIRLNFICKYKASTDVVSSTSTPESDDLQCPQGWLMSANQCYFESSVKSSWIDAEASCVKNDSHLASLHSASDLMGVAKSSSHVWIGLNDRDMEGKYGWTDGSALNYVNWTRSEPNVAPDQKDCILVVHGDWEVRNCSEEHKFVCQQPAIKDVDECQKNICPKKSTCINTIGSYTCQCHPGYSGPKCKDINECRISGSCHKHALCDNMQGSYKCRCRAGTFGDGKNCEDIDECELGIHNCSQHATCKNRHKSYNCKCNNGWRRRNKYNCELDIDECKEDKAICGPHATCLNTPGSYDCECKIGWQESGSSCVDVDECLNGNHGCSSNGVCVNTNGSYECHCNDGYSGDGKICEDVNECELERDDCDKEAECINTQGSFSCSCKPGWTGSGVTCVDINECEKESHDCDANAMCGNTNGLYTCECRLGWQGNGTFCEDKDECIETSDNKCDEHATCYNNLGSYSCACNPGYTGDGTTCQRLSCGILTDPKNGLKVGNGHKYGDRVDFKCDHGYNLSDTRHLSCEANGQWSRVVPECLEIDECSIGSHNCSHNADCKNVKGSFDCKCQEGYHGDGYQCDIVKCEDLGQIRNGHKSNDNVTYGSVVEFSCNKGYRLKNGIKSVLCQSDGQWRNSTPKCKDIDECTENKTACDPQHGKCTNIRGSFNCDCDVGYDLDTIDNWKCHPRPCPELTDPVDGKISGRVFTFESSVSFSCNTGYELKGQRLLTCMENGQWDREVPECQRISCGDPRNGAQPENLILNGTEYKYQSKITFSCKSGYKLQGVSTIHCKSTGNWSHMLPTCHDVNECREDNQICDMNADCTNTEGSYQCMCHPNWTGTGHHCEDINECDNGSHNCSSLATCYNLPGSFDCKCKEGLKKVGEKCVGFCNEDVTRGDQGNFIWQQTPAGSKATANCELGVIDKHLSTFASRLCKETSPGKAEWDEPDLSVCKYKNEMTNFLQKLATEEITEDNVEKVSESLEESLSKFAGNLSANDIDFTAKALENIVQIGGHSNTDKIGGQLLSITSSIMSAPAEAVAQSQKSGNATKKVVAALDTFVDVGLSSKRKTIEKQSRSVGLSANLVNEKEYKGSSFTLEHAEDSDTDSDTDSDLSDQDMTTGINNALPSDAIDAQISLPPTLLKEASHSPTNKQQKISFVVYKNAKLFPLQENETSSNLSIASRVISASVLGMKVVNLSNPVTIKLLHTQQSANTSVCVFWDFNMHGGFGGWSDEGCSRDSSGSTPEFTVCKCQHLTNFAIMMDLSYQIDGEALSDEVETALSVVSYIGCALSIIGLLLTLTALLYFKKLRASLLHQIHIQLCSALLLMLFVFLIGTERHGWKSHNTCAAFGAMLHYFILASFGWMGVEALYMYKSLIQVFNASSRKTFMLRASAVAWGIPVIPVIVVASIDSEHYTSSGYCWLNNIPAFFAAFFAPIMLILIWNVIVFLWVLRIIIRQSQANSIRYSKEKKKSKRKEFQASMAVMVLLGLTWLFGALMIRDGRLVFSFLFAITNSMQGFFVFLFHCALNKEVQKAFTFHFWPRMYRKHFVSTTNSSSINWRSTRKLSRTQTINIDLDEKKHGLKKQDTLEESLDESKMDIDKKYSVCEDAFEHGKKPEEPPIELISVKQIPDIISEVPDSTTGVDNNQTPTGESSGAYPKSNDTSNDLVVVLEPTANEETVDCLSDKDEQPQNSLPEQFIEHDHDNGVSEGEEIDSEYNPSENTHSECGQSRGRSFTPSNQLTLEVGSPNVSVYLTEDS